MGTHVAGATAGQASIGLNVTAAASKASTGIRTVGRTTIHSATHFAPTTIGPQASGHGSLAASMKATATGILSSGAKSRTASSATKIGWAAKASAVIAKGGVVAKALAVASVGVAGLVIAAHTGVAPGVETALSGVPAWTHAQSVLSQLQSDIQGGVSGRLNLQP
ncbi:MAG: hypothetical protein HKL79_01975 [Thermoplasmata archaeon]|nr:hypothetical protein [Thermoplasmata archaeon]